MTYVKTVVVEEKVIEIQNKVLQRYCAHCVIQFDLESYLRKDPIKLISICAPKKKQLKGWDCFGCPDFKPLRGSKK